MILYIFAGLIFTLILFFTYWIYEAEGPWYKTVVVGLFYFSTIPWIWPVILIGVIVQWIIIWRYQQSQQQS